ncbi:hypothetical protein H206_05389 [Candidatus Electrothrix aarhusensis]|uniref:Uncharacterized protein n=1 Tax=Candidatus Electrothrix aarhusensis TaxID=1859131 RepID=A0A3S3QUF2_9BACT|nr:hypothetical protein H206_05389 [Candidatus Electrothrix aarhusensis]
MQNIKRLPRMEGNTNFFSALNRPHNLLPCFVVAFKLMQDYSDVTSGISFVVHNSQPRRDFSSLSIKSDRLFHKMQTVIVQIAQLDQTAYLTYQVIALDFYFQ